MNQVQPKQKKVVNTLSVRLPPNLYNQVAEIALERGTTLNSVFIELVDSGLNFKDRERQILENFILSIVSEEKLKELTNGQAKIRITT